VHVSQFSIDENIDRLWDDALDALIVTGREPHAPHLRDEPYWPVLAQIVDWAARNTYSCIWSCLAAHAAVLHLDGIQRRRFKQKLFGVFDCTTAAGHPLFAGTPHQIRTPHSRWNDLSEDDLRAHGYLILRHSSEAGADTFSKVVRESLFIFFQGHPEYDAETLWLEYSRDIRRYLKAEYRDCPSPPRNYVANASAATPANTWGEHAVVFYRNWLKYIHARRCAAARTPFKQLSEAVYAQAGEVGR
jgi:homoserine O-succinyltransferase